MRGVGVGRGSGKARDAHSRDREANNADPPTSVCTIPAISDGAKAAAEPDGAVSVSGSRTTMPSSECID